MKNVFRSLFFFMSVAFVFQSCEEQHDNEVPSDIAINNFVWKGLNLYYLWQAGVPNLSDSRFSNQNQLNNFLYGYSLPETLFQDLLDKPISKFPNPEEAKDRFSVIFSDYNQLEGILSGTTKNNGIEYGLYYKNTTGNQVFGVVRYILPNSDAASKNIARGAIFYAVDGIPLMGSRGNINANNLKELLGKNVTYTLNFADYDAGDITPNGQSLIVTKTTLSENPVYITTVINSGTHKIGYLMYNGFYPNYEDQLNTAFGNLKAVGITELVLDLRYNSGGSIATATRLASMITGQYTGQVFATEQWNAKVEAYYNANNPGTLINLFENKTNTNATINSLNLTKVYVLTTKSTASASELVINGLEPYINVIQIGDKTTGKNVGSITLYDSPTFSKKDSSNKHRYAMQPLVLKIVNKVGFGDYSNGLEPDELLKENLSNLGILGDPNEPLLNAAVTRIIGGGRMLPINPEKTFETIQDNQPSNQLKNEMYLETLPEGLHLIK
ncbi:MAG: peptidase S41 [Burkholderiales bacterium]|nr:peptidase S41 [Flavobacterium sp.]